MEVREQKVWRGLAGGVGVRVNISRAGSFLAPSLGLNFILASLSQVSLAGRQMTLTCLQGRTGRTSYFRLGADTWMTGPQRKGMIILNKV